MEEWWSSAWNRSERAVSFLNKLEHIVESNVLFFLFVILLCILLLVVLFGELFRDSALRGASIKMQFINWYPSMSCDGLALAYLEEYVSFYALDTIQHLNRYSLMQQDFPLCPFLCNP